MNKISMTSIDNLQEAIENGVSAEMEVFGKPVTGWAYSGSFFYSGSFPMVVTSDSSLNLSLKTY